MSQKYIKKIQIPLHIFAICKNPLHIAKIYKEITDSFTYHKQKKEMVRLRRLELPRVFKPTATSTLRVYQFRHSRTVFGNASHPICAGMQCMA